MAKKTTQTCPECGDKVPAEPIDRRSFLRAAGAGAAALALARVPAWGQDTSNKTAEELIKELYTGLNDDQKRAILHPFADDKRLKIYNAALGTPIGKIYTKPQQELVGRILKSISSGEEGWKQISREGTWDASKSFDACGADLFGDVHGKFTWVFSGHHLTIRCDGNTDEGVAFGGPLYYGHTPNGYSERNCFFYQTKSALAAFEALTEKQREQAVCKDKPIEGMPSIKLRPADEAKPGIAYAELSKEAKALVEKTMADVLSPYRKADADEVLQVIKDKGGMDKVHLAFYKDEEAKSTRPWSFWRLEGPGFVWNYRVLPHVHTFVNISARI
jgi:hypothetical protein